MIRSENERNMLDIVTDVVGNIDIGLDSLYVIREGAFGFLTESKDSPIPGCLPHVQ